MPETLTPPAVPVPAIHTVTASLKPPVIVPVPPPAPAPETKTETPPAAPAEPPKAGDNDPLLKLMFKNWGIEQPKPKEETPPATDKPPGETKPKDGETPPAEKATEPPPTETPPTAEKDDKPAEVKRKRSEWQEEITAKLEELEQSIKPTAPDKATEPPTKLEQPPPPAEEVEDTSNLTPEELQALELAKYAEKAMPEKYTGHAKKLREYWDKVEAYVAKESKANPERTFDDSDEEFATWCRQNAPQYRPGDVESLKERKVAEEVETRVTSKLKAEREEVQRKLTELENRPKAQRDQTQFVNAMVEFMADPDPKKDGHELLAEITAKGKKDGIESIVKEYPIYGKIVADEAMHGLALSKELTELNYRLKPFNLNDRDHQELIEFIHKQDACTQSSPAQFRTRMVEVDGRQVKQTFMPRPEYDRLLRQNPQEATRHWSWKDQDYLVMLAIETKRKTVGKIREMEAALKAGGYVKPAPATPPPTPEVSKTTPKTPPPVESKSPKATAAPAPGAANGGPGIKPPGALHERELKWLGLA